MERDSLEKIFEKQQELIDFYHSVRKEAYESMDLDQKLFLHAIALQMEVAEFIAGLNWKPWKNKKDLDVEYLKEELVDMLHFWTELCIYLGLSPKEVVEKYMEKNKENKRRQIEGREKEDEYKAL